MYTENLEADLARLMGTDVDMRRRSSALFLLKLKEHRRMTQVALDDVVEGCQSLLQQTVQTVYAEVRSHLAEHGVDPDIVASLKDIFLKLVDPFDGIENKYKQEIYYKEKLGLVVSSYVRT